VFVGTTEERKKGKRRRGEMKTKEDLYNEVEELAEKVLEERAKAEMYKKRLLEEFAKGRFQIIKKHKEYSCLDWHSSLFCIDEIYKEIYGEEK